MLNVKDSGRVIQILKANASALTKADLLFIAKRLLEWAASRQR
jgi:hypothetical protein